MLNLDTTMLTDDDWDEWGHVSMGPEFVSLNSVFTLFSLLQLRALTQTGGTLCLCAVKLQNVEKSTALPRTSGWVEDGRSIPFNRSA